jgi:hypothetical protein
MILGRRIPGGNRTRFIKWYARTRVNFMERPTTTSRKLSPEQSGSVARTTIIFGFSPIEQIRIFRSRTSGSAVADDPRDQRISHITSFYRFPYKRQVLCLGDKVRQPPLLVASTRALHGFTGYTLLYTQGLIRLDTDRQIQTHTYT